MILVALHRSHTGFAVSRGEQPLTVGQLKAIIRETRGYSEAKQTLWRGGERLEDEEEVEAGQKLLLALAQYPLSVAFQAQAPVSLQVSADMTGLEVLRLALAAYQLACSGGHLQYPEEWRSLADDEEIGEIGQTLRLYPAAKVTLCSPLGTVISESYLCIHKPIQRLVYTTVDRFRLSPNMRAMTESGILITGWESLEDLGITSDLRLFLLNPSPFPLSRETY